MSSAYLKNVCLLAAALSMLSSTAFANPLSTVPSLVKRQSEVENPTYPEWLSGAEGGNVKIGVNDNKVVCTTERLLVPSQLTPVSPVSWACHWPISDHLSQ